MNNNNDKTSIENKALDYAASDPGTVEVNGMTVPTYITTDAQRQATVEGVTYQWGVPKDNLDKVRLANDWFAELDKQRNNG